MSKAFFKVQKTIQPIFNDGKLWLSSDGNVAISSWEDTVIATSLTNGERIGIVKGDSSDVSAFAIVSESPTELRLLIACKSLSLLFFSLSVGTSAASYVLNRTVSRAHDAPIVVAASHEAGVFATGSADGMVKLWNVAQGHCTHVFRGHGGPLAALCLDLRHDGSDTRALLYSSATDCRVRIWDLQTSSCLQVIDSHVSVPVSLSTSEDGKWLVSGGRDEVVHLWEFTKGKKPYRLSKTILAYESVESCGFANAALADGVVSYSIYTAGHSGKLRFWDLKTAKVLLQVEDASSHPILQALANEITTIHIDHNIFTRRLDSPELPVTRQIAGFNDEIVDLTLLCPSNPSDSSTFETHVAVATNSDVIRVYETSSHQATFLAGHTDVVLALSKSSDHRLIISGSKDKTVRVWSHIGENNWHCIALGEGHLESIGAVTAPHQNRAFFISASQDLTCKFWDLSDVDGPSESRLSSLLTTKVHDKDINTLDMSANDQFVATGSQDKTAKIFQITYSSKTKSSPASIQAELRGVLKGHRRGIWSVKFGPNSRQVATSSSDKTVRLWNVEDMTYLRRTYQFLLKVDWLSARQLVSAGSDGLVKVWSTENETCMSTLDNHYDKIWCVAASRDRRTVVSGGADSMLNIWIDITEEKEEEQIATRNEDVLKEQEFTNFLAIKDYKNAIVVAMETKNGPRLLRLFSLVWRHRGEQDVEFLTGSKDVDAVIDSLSPEQLEQLLKFVRDWNTNTRTAGIAQVILHAILKTFTWHKVQAALGSTSPSTEHAKQTESSLDVINSLIPFTERHYAKLERMAADSFSLNYALEL
ncbi:WD40 repeat-like protein [Atractiella rhizophila]|nr:WD40 repeat-like protein [Atractiella rhizophila]